MRNARMRVDPCGRKAACSRPHPSANEPSHTLVLTSATACAQGRARHTARPHSRAPVGRQRTSASRAPRRSSWTDARIPTRAYSAGDLRALHSCVLCPPVRLVSCPVRRCPDTANITEYLDSHGAYHRVIQHAPLKGVTSEMMRWYASFCRPSFWRGQAPHRHTGTDEGCVVPAPCTDRPVVRCVRLCVYCTGGFRRTSPHCLHRSYTMANMSIGTR